MARPRKIKSPPQDFRAPNEYDPSAPDEWEDARVYIESITGTPMPDKPPECPPEEAARLAAVCRQFQINCLRVAPLNDEPLACLLAATILGRASERERAEVGAFICWAMETSTPEQLEKFFARVMVLKRNASALPHRHAYAYLAYSRFIEETGREPLKPELKRYLLARRESFKDIPAAEDGAGWKRVWKQTGLFTLPKKSGTKP